MSSIRKKSEQIRQSIFNAIVAGIDNPVSQVAEEYQISRQAIHSHIKKLVAQGILISHGSTRNRRYTLAKQDLLEQTYTVDQNLSEFDTWSQDIAPLFASLPDNVKHIWEYGFTEMVNNVIDHSSGQKMILRVSRTHATTKLSIQDNGVGIFRKIKHALNLSDERHSVLELAKGKLTTDPDNHSGQGIFFSSRMFDKFAILSGEVFFSHHSDELEDWILSDKNRSLDGTSVSMELSNNTARTDKEVFDDFAQGNEYAFNKTVVPMRMAEYGDERLVSRSQAKRLLTGLNKFAIVLFDFEGVDFIGQAFADQVFRVFQNQHPDMELAYDNACEPVQKMISRALNHEK